MTSLPRAGRRLRSQYDYVSLGRARGATQSSSVRLPLSSDDEASRRPSRRAQWPRIATPASTIGGQMAAYSRPRRGAQAGRRVGRVFAPCRGTSHRPLPTQVAVHAIQKPRVRARNPSARSNPQASTIMVIHDITRRIAVEKDIPSILEAAVDGVHRFLGADAAFAASACHAELLPRLRHPRCGRGPACGARYTADDRAGRQGRDAWTCDGSLRR